MPHLISSTIWKLLSFWAPMQPIAVLFCLLLIAVTIVLWKPRRSKALFFSLPYLTFLSTTLPIVLAITIFAYFRKELWNDHVEPNTGVLSILLARGYPLYHELDSPYRYSVILGPLIYIVNVINYKWLGISIFSTKVGPTVAGLAGLVMVMLTLTRSRFEKVSLRISLCYVLFAILFLGAFLLYWPRPDPYLFLLSAIGLYLTLIASTWGATIGVGAAAGLAFLAKIHGLAYFIPLLIPLIRRLSKAQIVVAAMVMVLTGALPFLLSPAISFTGYLRWVMIALNHRRDPETVRQCLFVITLLTAPSWLLALTVLKTADLTMRKELHSIIGSAVTAATVVTIVASKEGAGPHHYFPFLPYLAWATAWGIDRLQKQRFDTNLPSGINVFFFCYTLALTPTVGLTFLNTIRNARHGDSELVLSDVRGILARYGSQSIQMGYGSSLRKYPVTFHRFELVKVGNEICLDGAALMDMEAAGIGVPPETLHECFKGNPKIWLIPKGEDPFTMPGWYSGRGAIFPGALGKHLRSNYVIQEKTNYFDVWSYSDETRRGRE